MVDEEQIKALLKQHFKTTGDVTINNITGTVSVSGDVKLKPSIKIGQLPVRFEHVGGSFYCDNNQLVSLAGAPSHVGGGFYCHSNQLVSLAGAPSHVGGSFYCDNNQLVSLSGAPSHVGGGFYCENNQLASLEGAPSHVGGSFFCSYVKKLPLLRLLVYRSIVVIDEPLELRQVLDKYAGTGRRGAFKAAKEIMQAGEQLRQLQGLDHNPFEANARW